jgi:hypothetical protein
MAKRRETEELTNARAKRQKTMTATERKRRQREREVARDIQKGKRDATGKLIPVKVRLQFTCM